MDVSLDKLNFVKFWLRIRTQDLDWMRLGRGLHFPVAPVCLLIACHQSKVLLVAIFRCAGQLTSKWSA